MRLLIFSAGRFQVVVDEIAGRFAHAPGHLAALMLYVFFQFVAVFVVEDISGDDECQPCAAVAPGLQVGFRYAEDFL